MRRRGLRGNVTRSSRAMAGLRSQALRPAARSWLTSVAGPRFESAARASQNAAAERRKARSYPIAREERDHRKTSHLQGPRKPQRLPALRSPRSGACEIDEQRGPARGRPKNTGDESCLRRRSRLFLSSPRRRGPIRHSLSILLRSMVPGPATARRRRASTRLWLARDESGTAIPSALLPRPARVYNDPQTQSQE